MHSTLLLVASSIYSSYLISILISKEKNELYAARWPKTLLDSSSFPPLLTIDHRDTLYQAKSWSFYKGINVFILQATFIFLGAFY